MFSDFRKETKQLNNSTTLYKDGLPAEFGSVLSVDDKQNETKLLFDEFGVVCLGENKPLTLKFGTPIYVERILLSSGSTGSIIINEKGFGFIYFY